MESNLKYKKAFVIVVYGIIIQLLLLPIVEIDTLRPGMFQSYAITKSLLTFLFCAFAYCLNFNKLINWWVKLFYIGCFSYVIIGQYFHPGYQYAVIEFMFIVAIIFEGFPLMSLILMAVYIVEYMVTRPDSARYPYYHFVIMNSLISTWLISVFLERYVNRVRHKQDFLDKKLRYKGIKTDLLLHDLKNRLQPMVFNYSNDNGFKEILKSIQSFNSFQEDHEVTLDEVVVATKKKYNIQGEVSVSGTEDFFIDQMDLQTILCNLMTNSQKAANVRGIDLQMKIVNTNKGFSFADNAGGFTEEQFKFFSQKEIKPYPGHEKNGLGILLIKKLVEHQGGTLVIKRIPDGTKFEINY